MAFEISEYQELIAGDTSCEWTTFYRSIFGKGEMEIIDDVMQKRQGLDVIMHQHGKIKNSYMPNLLERIFILKLRITEMSAKANGREK